MTDPDKVIDDAIVEAKKAINTDDLYDDYNYRDYAEEVDDDIDFDLSIIGDKINHLATHKNHVWTKINVGQLEGIIDKLKKKRMELE
jgi:hypothetical protein